MQALEIADLWSRVSRSATMEMSLPIPTVSSAEILEIRDGQIVRGENIYDAEPMCQAMPQA